MSEALREYVHLTGAQMKAYTFEGRSFIVQYHPDLGSYAHLSDLCDILSCGAPPTVLPRLSDSDDDSCLFAVPDFPGSSLVNLDGSRMETLRALAPDWDQAVRFRAWLIETIFHIPPHVTRDEERWAANLEIRTELDAKYGPDPSAFGSQDEVREHYWRLERAARSRPRAEVIAFPVGGRPRGPRL